MVPLLKVPPAEVSPCSVAVGRNRYTPVGIPAVGIAGERVQGTLGPRFMECGLLPGSAGNGGG